MKISAALEPPSPSAGAHPRWSPIPLWVTLQLSRAAPDGLTKLLLERETLEGTELAAALSDRGDPPAPHPTSSRPGPPPRAGVLPDWVTVAAGVKDVRGGNRVRDGPR